MAKDVKRALMIAKAEGDEVARGQRKRAAGFDPDRVLYHGTNKDIQAFTPKRAGKRETMGLKGTHLADNPEFANLYAEGRGANVMPVHARGNFLDAGKLVYEGSPEHEVLTELLKGQRNVRALWNTDHEGKRVAPPLHSYLDAVSPQKAERILRAKGYDGVTYPAKYGFNDGRVSARSNATVVFDPKNIRSQFAQFDPAHNDSDDISKAAGGSATKRALMIARDQRNLLRRIANIYHGPGGGMDPSPGGGGYSGPGGGKYIGPSHYAEGGKVDYEANKARFLKGSAVRHPVYHGTSDDISYFSLTHPNRKDAGWLGHGIYLTESPQIANAYATQKRGNAAPNVMKLHARITKPYYATTADKQKFRMIEHHDGREAAQQAAMDWTNELRAKGHDGVIYEGPIKGSTEYVVFDPENVKSATGNRGTFDNSTDDVNYADGGSVPPFKLHSGAAKLIAAKGQKKATPQQYAAMPGIKPDELKHSKFDTLGSKALPREEVIKHLEDNAIPLEETQLGGGSRKATKFHDPKYQLPGGKNYREVLLHTPVEVPPASPEAEKVRARADAAGRAYDDALTDQLSGTPRFSDDEYRRASDEYDAANIALSRFEASRKREEAQAGFRKGHWETPNVLAHVRMSDRRGPNGEKVLHVEEVQSDWGQAGREHGFGAPEIRHAGDRWTAHDPTGNVIAQGRLEDFRDDQHIMENVAPGRTIPSGPYVDNTQKWTDLALKRVLHEAAHGGYDKIAFTPGDEQNKRYDLSKQVKNINYFPDIGYLHAETHDGRGIEHDDVKPDDLAKHVGKEAADRLLKQELQRHEGRGRLGGEFYHELEGDDLKMGGAGMRGYYDNILPKRLQALAQQHDPQAKVQLGSTPVADDTTPLHSLDVTPQMRDSIKQSGFNSFKRGGEVGDDPIKDWQWRPTEDVRNELQLDEIPSHVHKFGEFMDETARRAATQGLTPRDLIKAYAITRSSIGRGALPVATVRRPKNPEYGFDALPKGLQGTLRPEGAMGHWLHTKMGQRYLDEAEAGRVDEEAVRDAIKSMGAFGLPDTAEGKALRWAPKNLPGQEGRVSELIARAHRGQSSPEEWRGEMRVPGIAESKAGFFASMLGRGDQPTLDARQIILHTGRPTKQAAPHLSPKGAKEAAVNRLADRQSALGLKHDKSMSPFYQHLTHHAIWDKTGGEETTHDDLMQALRGSKDGGRQGYAKGGAAHHPVAAVLRQALPLEAFTDATPSQVRAALEKTVSPFSGDPEHVKEALRIASTFKVPTTTTSPGGYYNISQDRSPEEVSTKLEGLPGVKPKPVRKMSWEDLHKKGGSFINLGGDRSTFGRLSRINGEPLAWPVDLHAGPNYMRELNPGLVWANAPGHATSITNTIRRAADKGPVYGIYAPMGPRAIDSAHHMFDAVMAQIPARDISKKDAAAFDAEIKKGMHMPLKKRPSAIKALEKWPGILNAKEASEFARTLPGEQRSGIIQHMDKKLWKDKGFPQIGVTRVAITDPDVFKASGNMLGHRVVQLDPDKMVEETKFKHGTYTAPTAGEYVGDVPLVQRHYAAPDVIEQRLMKPTVAGDIIHPYSASPVGRSSARKIFEEQKNIQPLNQRQLDSTMQGLERQKQYGLKTGGRAGYALSGRVEQLGRDLGQSFSGLNRQVAAAPQRQAAPAGGDYQAMTQQATGQAPDAAYARMLAQALNGKTYEEMFPTAAKPAAPAAAAPAAVEQPVQTADASSQPFDYGSWMTSLMGGGGGGLKRGGKVNIVERALAVTRRK